MDARRKVIAAPRNAAEVLALSVSVVLCCGAAAAVASDRGVSILPSVQSVLTQEVPATTAASGAAGPQESRAASRTPARRPLPLPTDVVHPTSRSSTTAFQNPFVSDFPASDELPPVLTEQTTGPLASSSSENASVTVTGTPSEPTSSPPSDEPSSVGSTDPSVDATVPVDEPSEPSVDPTGSTPIPPTETTVDPSESTTTPPTGTESPTVGPTDPAADPGPTPTPEVTASAAPGPGPQGSEWAGQGTTPS